MKMPHLAMHARCMSLVAAALLTILAAAHGEDVDAGAHEDIEGDLHRWSMRQYLQEPPEPLRREVLLVGDGDRMRFWPMWPFYKYLAASVTLAGNTRTGAARGGGSQPRQGGEPGAEESIEGQPVCKSRRDSAGGGTGGSRRAEAGRGSMVTLVTPRTPGFRRGMACDEAVEAFARSYRPLLYFPLLYFLVSPGDQPLILAGAREYLGPKVLEVEDMEGEARLAHLINSNRVDFVVYRYFSPELLALQVSPPPPSSLSHPAPPPSLR